MSVFQIKRLVGSRLWTRSGNWFYSQCYCLLALWPYLSTQCLGISICKTRGLHVQFKYSIVDFPVSMACYWTSLAIQWPKSHLAREHYTQQHHPLKSTLPVDKLLNVFSLPYLHHHLCSTFWSNFTRIVIKASLYTAWTPFGIDLPVGGHLWGSGNFIFSKDLLQAKWSKVFSLSFCVSHPNLAALKGSVYLICLLSDS